MTEPPSAQPFDSGGLTGRTATGQFAKGNKATKGRAPDRAAGRPKPPSACFRTPHPGTEGAIPTP
jgi:hypothetical protein